ncbi:MAG: rhomboid family intramembrane serine protease, partial [Alphaproteobacteria bacterium]
MIPIRTSVKVDEIPGAVVGLIIANVAVFLVQSGLPAELREDFILHNALVPARYTQPDVAGELGLDPGNFLPLLTNTFMHVGWLHLIVNMWTLWLFGRPLEERLGAVRFVLMYLVCGAIASLAHLAFNLYSPVPALGASGAVAGILGAYTLLYPRARVVLVTLVLFFPTVFSLPAAVYTAIWFVLQLLQGVAELVVPEHTAGIAWWAHIGGFVAGLALIGVVGTRRREARAIGPARGQTREVGVQLSGVRTVGP